MFAGKRPREISPTETIYVPSNPPGYSGTVVVQHERTQQHTRQPSTKKKKAIVQDTTTTNASINNKKKLPSLPRPPNG